MPHTLHALDSEHISINKLHMSESICYNYKGIFSVILMALVNVDYQFIQIDTDSWIEGQDHQSDGQLHGDSTLKGCIKDKLINFLDDDPLLNDDRDVPYFILGDDRGSVL